MSFEGSEDSNKNKKTISYEDWMKGINQKRVSKQELNKLIMNFFLVEGFLILNNIKRKIKHIIMYLY